MYMQIIAGRTRCVPVDVSVDWDKLTIIPEDKIPEDHDVRVYLMHNGVMHCLWHGTDTVDLPVEYKGVLSLTKEEGEI